MASTKDRLKNAIAGNFSWSQKLQEWRLAGNFEIKAGGSIGLRKICEV